MENLLLPKKRHLMSENSEEFFLNSRDIFINGRLLNTQNSVKKHELNEIITMLLEESIVFIDLKNSVQKAFTIIRQVKYDDFYKILSPYLKSKDDDNGSGSVAKMNNGAESSIAFEESCLESGNENDSESVSNDETSNRKSSKKRGRKDKLYFKVKKNQEELSSNEGSKTSSVKKTKKKAKIAKNKKKKSKKDFQFLMFYKLSERFQIKDIQIHETQLCLLVFTLLVTLNSGDCFILDINLNNEKMNIRMIRKMSLKCCVVVDKNEKEVKTKKKEKENVKSVKDTDINTYTNNLMFVQINNPNLKLKEEIYKITETMVVAFFSISNPGILSFLAISKTMENIGEFNINYIIDEKEKVTYNDKTGDTSSKILNPISDIKATVIEDRQIIVYYLTDDFNIVYHIYHLRHQEQESLIKNGADLSLPQTKELLSENAVISSKKETDENVQKKSKVTGLNGHTPVNATTYSQVSPMKTKNEKIVNKVASTKANTLAMNNTKLTSFFQVKPKPNNGLMNTKESETVELTKVNEQNLNVERRRDTVITFSGKVDFDSQEITTYFQICRNNRNHLLLSSKLSYISIKLLEGNIFLDLYKIVLNSYSFSVMKGIFLLDNSVYYFNSRGEFSSSKIDINQRDNVICKDNNEISKIVLNQEVFEVCLFDSRAGFYIVGNNNIIKNNDLIIEVFIPANIASLGLDFFNTQETNKSNNANYSFVNLANQHFTWSLSELLILNHRKLIESIHLDNLQIFKKLELYNRFFDEESKGFEVAFMVKRTITKEVYSHLLDLISQSHKNIQAKRDDESFICEICGDKNGLFESETMSLRCSNGHLTLACCISKRPISSNSSKRSFLICDFCFMTFENASLGEIKKGLLPNCCIFCQNTLRNL